MANAKRIHQLLNRLYKICDELRNLWTNGVQRRQ